MTETPAVRKVVAYRDTSLRYPDTAPFDPECAYPEYPFEKRFTAPQNQIYHAVREVLRDAGLDKNHFGTNEWNPIGDLVEPGRTVLIKPNWVRHYHPLGYDPFGMITHPAVLRPLVDYAFKAVGSHGRIWMMDAPLYDTDFPTLKKICQLDDLQSSLRARGVPLTIADLRSLVVKMDRGVVVKRIRQDRWESEGVVFDLADSSELVELCSTLKNIFGSDYDRRMTTAFHCQADGHQRHCYRISRRVLEADLVISVPKLKTHKKTGVTLNIKNMIGINTDKNYIPHFRIGAPDQGGDEYPNTSSFMKQVRRLAVRRARETVLGRLGHRGERVAHLFMTLLLAIRDRPSPDETAPTIDAVDIFYHSVQGDTHRHGDWSGNDTCWRSALDINKILLYGTVEGALKTEKVRRYFSVIDGVLAGDQTGPLAPTPRAEGVLVAGFDPLSVDQVATQIMGFAPELIRDQARASQLSQYPISNSEIPIQTISNIPEWQNTIKPGSDLQFRPHFGWTYYLQKCNQSVNP